MVTVRKHKSTPQGWQQGRMKMKLSAEDIEILQIEKEIYRLNAVKEKIPSGNTESEEKLHKKMQKLWDRQSTMIYDRKGNYRSDKRHLLNGCSLDTSLLDNAE